MQFEETFSLLQQLSLFKLIFRDSSKVGTCMQYVHESILQYILAQNLKLHVTYAERILFQTTLVKVGKGISSQGPREGYVGEQALLCQCVLSDLKQRPLCSAGNNFSLFTGHMSFQIFLLVGHLTNWAGHKTLTDNAL